MERLRHVVGHLLAVASKHDSLVDAKGMELGNGLSTIRLDLVVDDDMTSILTIDRHMDNGTDVMAVVPTSADGVHHLCITHADNLIPYPCTDAVTCNLLNISDLTAVGGLIREGIAQGCADGMGGEMFYMRCEVQQLVFVANIRVNSLNGELAMGKSAGLIENHGIDLSEDIHIVSALDEDTLARSTANTTKERKRHANNKSTGTRDNKEHQGPIQPCSEVTTKERRQDGEGQGCENHDGRIDTGKTGDKGLTLRFALASILYKTDDFRDGALTKSLRGTDTQDTREIDTTRDDLVAHIHIARQRFTCQGYGIQGRRALDDDAIQGDLLTRTDDDNLPHSNGLRADIF